MVKEVLILLHSSIHTLFASYLLGNNGAFPCQGHWNLHNIGVVHFPRLQDSGFIQISQATNAED